MNEREIAPSPERNKQPILDILARVLPPTGFVLEIGSGTGQHVAHFARALPRLTFQPSEMDTDKHPSIAAWVRHENLSNVRAPIAIDLTQRPWPVRAAEAIVCINVIHISPWAATVALMQGAGEILTAGGVLVTYGPYRRDGKHTAPSNEEFDAWLKERDPGFGVRNREAVIEEARKGNLALEEAVAMPANNFTLVFRRATFASAA